MNIPEGDFYLIDKKRFRITNTSTASGAGTIGSTPDSHVVEAIAAGEKTWELRDACVTVTLPNGSGTARLADMNKNDTFVIHETDTRARITHRLLVRVAQAPRSYDSHGQAVAELREAVMPPSVTSRLGLHPKATMFTDAWGEEIYQLGVLRHPTFNPDRRTPVIALRTSTPSDGCRRSPRAAAPPSPPPAAAPG